MPQVIETDNQTLIEHQMIENRTTHEDNWDLKEWIMAQYQINIDTRMEFHLPSSNFILTI